MGLIAKLRSFTRTTEDDAPVTDAKVDRGGNDNVNARHFACPGDDSHPLPDDTVAVSSSTGTGNLQVTGYLDPTNEPQAAAGEKRIYSRDDEGVVVAVVWLKNDGTLELGLDPTDFVARASRVLEELEAVKADLDGFKSTFDSHIHTTTATVGTGSAGVISTPSNGTFPSPHEPESVASETVKVQP